ncbi:hypothetical protein Tsubulata_023934 [Turnera subulata]|uniref:NB-ARC domain-containing protein n=1 Tax=Turnera subulata TaxID=218843 RepID=A0A9Q0FYI1_9ROSI|nr:hypothetical protein Tsubulata_023934 [Turnera subulata]
MSEGVVTFLLVKLADFLVEKGEHMATVKDDAEYISDELEFMTAFLRHADAVEDGDPVLRLLVKKVRELAYDTEDALDDFRLCLTHGDGHGLFSCFKKLTRSIKDARAMRRIACKIECIKSRVISISESHRRYCNKNNISVQGSSSRSMQMTEYCQEDALLIEEADLVGVKKRKEQLVERLLSIDRGRQVVSVVGMAGLGKSTLVKKVFDDPDIMQQFKFRAWVTVSQSFKIKDLLQRMVRQLFHVPRKPDRLRKPDYAWDEMDFDQLRTTVNSFLRHKKYLIVLDEVWHCDLWDSLRYILPDNTCGSKVLLTTRNNGVASACCLEFPNNVCVLNPLSPEESWTLFCKKVFQGSCYPQHLKKVSEAILGRCEGLPLAIVAVSGVLATKDMNRIDEWQMVHRCIGAELEGNDRMRITTICLTTSNPVSCTVASFLDPIWRARLVRLWIAEGFVKEKEGKNLEEVAEDYLGELLKRNLIQVVETTSYGRVKKCRIHDLLRESIISKSRDQDFVAVAKEPSMSWSEKFRRLSMHVASQQHTEQVHITSRLRSLLMFWGLDSRSRSSKFDLSTGGLKLINVLDLRGAPLPTFPVEVSNLLLLKYLCLRDTKVNSVPNSIGVLQNLETLDLKHCPVTELPLQILKLQRLQNLLVYRYGMMCTKVGFKAPPPKKKKEGNKLILELGRLNKLRRLGIVKLKRENGKALCSSIEKLRDLRALSITSLDENEIVDLQYLSCPPPFLQRLYLTARLQKLPKWISCLEVLVMLKMRRTKLRHDLLVSLQCLPNLVHLEFVEAYEGETLNFQSGVLGLNKLNFLRSITIQDGAMPSLHNLTVQCCKLLQKIPFGIEHLTELKVVQFLDMPIDFIKRLRPNDGGEGYVKVQNIPEVYCTFLTNGCWDVYSVKNCRERKRYPELGGDFQRREMLSH